MATVTLLKRRTHHYAKHREAVGDEDVSMQTVRPEKQSEVDAAQVAIFEINEREKALQSAWKPSPNAGALPSLHEERAAAYARLDTASRDALQNWVAVRQYVVEYASADGRYHLGVELPLAEVDKAAAEIAVDLPW